MRYKIIFIVTLGFGLGYLLTQAMYESQITTPVSPSSSPETFLNELNEKVEAFSLKADTIITEMQQLYKTFKTARQKAVDVWFTNLSKQSTWLTTTGQRPWENFGKFAPFVQKLLVQPGHVVYIFGDIHGDKKALFNALKKLTADGVIDAEGKIKENNHLIFLGDYVDRGPQGVDVWYTLLTLRAANNDPASVVFLRGNHEDAEMNIEYSMNEKNGYCAELQKKFGLPCYTNENVYKKSYNYLTTQLYNFLPVALYLSCEHNTVLCVHGGLEIGFDPKPLLNEKDPQKIYMPLGLLKQRSATETLPPYLKKELSLILPLRNFVPKDIYDLNFLWNDFSEKTTSEPSERGQSTFTLGTALTRELLNRDGITCVFRGHQHELVFNNNPEHFGEYTLPSGLVHTIISFGKILEYDTVCAAYSFIKLETGATFSEWKAWHLRDDHEYPINLAIQEPTEEEIAFAKNEQQPKVRLKIPE